MRAIEGNLKRQRVAPRHQRCRICQRYLRYDVPAQQRADWIAAAGVDGAASSLFNESPLAVKLARWTRGPSTGNAYACLVARVIRRKKLTGTGGRLMGQCAY